MPNHSSKKKKGQQTNITIDEKHTQMLNEFHSVESDTIPELEQTLLVLKNQFRALDESDIDQKMEVKDQIRDITEQLKKYKTMKNDYLLKNASYIFNYFEEKKKISSGGDSGNKNILNSFFKIKSESDIATNPKYQKFQEFIPKLLEKRQQRLYSIGLRCLHRYLPEMLGRRTYSSRWRGYSDLQQQQVRNLRAIYCGQWEADLQRTAQRGHLQCLRPFEPFQGNLVAISGEGNHANSHPRHWSHSRANQERENPRHDQRNQLREDARNFKEVRIQPILWAHPVYQLHFWNQTAGNERRTPRHIVHPLHWNPGAVGDSLPRLQDEFFQLHIYIVPVVRVVEPDTVFAVYSNDER